MNSNTLRFTLAKVFIRPKAVKDKNKMRLTLLFFAFVLFCYAMAYADMPVRENVRVDGRSRSNGDFKDNRRDREGQKDMKKGLRERGENRRSMNKMVKPPKADDSDELPRIPKDDSIQLPIGPALHL